MLAPLIVAEIVPARNARLLLVSSQASPPSSRQSFQKAPVNLRASIVCLLLLTIFPLSSISAPPKHQVTGYAHWLGSPRLWPPPCPTGPALFLTSVLPPRRSSQASGMLSAPASLTH